MDGEGVEEAIIEANEDSNVDGIMVYYPIFGGSQVSASKFIQLRKLLSKHQCFDRTTTSNKSFLPSRMSRGFMSSSIITYITISGATHDLLQTIVTYKHARFIRPKSLLGLPTPSQSPVAPTSTTDDAPEGFVKSIIPCTPLAIVKALEAVGVYNTILDYGDRAYGRTVTVINRSEVVGRPLAALLANDGARVFSVDIDSIQEYTKRPVVQVNGAEKVKRYNPRHVVHPCPSSLEQCLAISDVVVTAVPSAKYKVPTAWLKDGCICVNVASEKNFEADVREKVSILRIYAINC